MWDLPRPGLEPVSPALAGRFSTTAPPGKPLHSFFMLNFWTPVCIFTSSAYLNQTHCISVDQWATWSRWLSYWPAQSSPCLSIGLHQFFHSPLWNSHSSVGEFPSVGPRVVLSYFLVFVQVSPWSTLHHLCYPTWLIPTYSSPKLILLGKKKTVGEEKLFLCPLRFVIGRDLRI